MSPFRKKKIKTKFPEDLIQDKIPKGKVDENSWSKDYIQDFNPPPKKTKKYTESINSKSKHATNAGKIDKKSFSNESKPLPLGIKSKTDKRKTIPFQTGLKKKKKEKHNVAIPKHILEKRTNKKRKIPKDFGGIRNKMELLNRKIPKDELNSDESLKQQNLSNQGRNEESNKVDNNPFSKKKRFRISKVNSKSLPSTFEKEIPKSKIKSKKPK